jgi:hypothetical protein
LEVAGRTKFIVLDIFFSMKVVCEEDGSEECKEESKMKPLLVLFSHTQRLH